VPPGAVLVGALTMTVSVWAVLQQCEPRLGHDESVYAGKAREWATGTPATGWEAYRPVALPALGSLALRVSNSTSAVRLVGLALALFTLGAVYAVASRTVGRRHAAVSILVILGGATFLRRLPEFLDDIPAAGLLLVGAYLVARSRRPGGRWALVRAALVADVMLPLRYGSLAGLLSVLGAAVLIWGPRTWARDWRRVVEAAAVFCAGLVPLAVYGRQATGSWFGIFRQAEAIAHRAYVGEGLVYYATAYPFTLAGLLGAVVMAAGLARTLQDSATVLHLPGGGRRRSSRDRASPRGGDPGSGPVALVLPDTSTGQARAGGLVPPSDDEQVRLRAFLGCAAVIELLLLGLDAHGEGRFVLFTIFTLCVLGVRALTDVLPTSRRPAALLALTVLAVVAVPVDTAVIWVQIHQVTGQLDAADSVGSVIAADARRPATRSSRPGAGSFRLDSTTRRGSDRSCLVITALPEEVAWVSGCRAVAPDRAWPLPRAVTAYAILFPGRSGWPTWTLIGRLDPLRTWSVQDLGRRGDLGHAELAVSAPPG